MGVRGWGGGAAQRTPALLPPPKRLRSRYFGCDTCWEGEPALPPPPFFPFPLPFFRNRPFATGARGGQDPAGGVLSRPGGGGRSRR